MSHVLTVPDEIAEAVEILARSSGRSGTELLLEALRAHFPPVSQELREEFEMWDRASEEDFVNFEKTSGEDADATR